MKTSSFLRIFLDVLSNRALIWSIVQLSVLGTWGLSMGMRTIRNIPLSIKHLRPHPEKKGTHTHIIPLTYLRTNLLTPTNLLLGHIRAAKHTYLVYSANNYNFSLINTLTFTRSKF